MPPLSEVVRGQSGEGQTTSDVWALAKGTRVAVCRIRLHAAGREVVVVVDQVEWLSVVGRDVVSLLERAAEWQAEFCGNGWTPVAWPIESSTT